MTTFSINSTRICIWSRSKTACTISRTIVFETASRKTFYWNAFKDYGSIDHQDVTEVAAFVHKVFPDDEVREYFFDQVWQLFVGGNQDKIILIWKVTGDKGKTVTQRLFEKMLGPLAVKIKLSHHMGKRRNWARQRRNSLVPEIELDGWLWVVENFKRKLDCLFKDRGYE